MIDCPRIVLAVAIVLLCCCALTETTSPQPYCNINETVPITTSVPKTRIVEKKLERGLKFWQKPKTTKVVEIYYEEVVTNHQNLMIRCCSGYAMSALKLCEPVCAAGCPSAARCVEPNRCQCRPGYMPVVTPHDGEHHCQPTCRSNCPKHMHCAAPDVCECERGYHVHEGQCVPICSAACPSPEREECARPDVCECRAGFVRDAETQLCEVATSDSAKSTEETLTSETWTSASMDYEDGLVIAEESTPDLDENEKIFLSTQRTIIIISGEESVESDSMDSESGESTSTEPSTSADCDAGHFKYRGECRPVLFANEPHCRFKPCGSHAHCLTNGTCACVGDYVWHRRATMPAADVEGEVVATARCVSQQELAALLAAPSADAAADEDGNRWMVAFFATLGVLCIVGALVFLGVKYAYRQHDSVDVKHMNDLLCKYEKSVA